MLASLISECKEQWVKAKHNKKHSFRFFTMATTASDGSPHLRTVVLRDFNPDSIDFTIYTDLRSKKVYELEQNNKAQFLFYDPKRMLQIVVGACLVESNSDELIYKSIPEQSKKDYCAEMNPGSEINSPESVQYDFSKGHFIKLVFKAETIEYLRLKRPNHLRAIFRSEDKWKGSFLVP